MFDGPRLLSKTGLLPQAEPILLQANTGDQMKLDLFQTIATALFSHCKSHDFFSFKYFFTYTVQLWSTL